MSSSLQTLILVVASYLLQLCSAGFQYHEPPWSPDYVLAATAENVTINCKSRYSVIVNGTTPGPPLYLKEGQTTWIRVYNNIADQNFTMHWHGLTQRTAPFADGTPLVSQWPIAPGDYFDYEIHPDIGDAGTYFYHSHVGFQAITAHGALIVEDATEPPYHYDHDQIIAFSDYYNKNDSTVVDGLLADPFEWSGEPDALVFNDRSGNASFTNATDDSCKPYVLKVKPGQTYRIRFIGRTALSLVTMGFEDHTNLTIIEADGRYTHPFTTDHIQLGTGQRFSILFTTKTESELMAANKTQYWIRYESRARPVNVTGYALLEYELPNPDPLPSALPSTSPIILPNQVNNWLEYSLETLNPDRPFPSLSQVTRTVYITMSQELFNGSYTNNTINASLEWAENTDTWSEPRLQNTSLTPYLVNLFLTHTTPNYTAALSNRGWDPNTRAFPALVNETLDIVWLSNSGPTGGWDVHPMHAHGRHYWDLGSGNGTYNATQNEARFANYTPALRDTTMLYRYATSGAVNETAGWRAWRIQVSEDDVGAWLMHCHILQHMVMGMQTVWVFGDADQILAKFPDEPYVKGYLEYGGSAYGNSSYDPLVNEKFARSDVAVR